MAANTIRLLIAGSQAGGLIGMSGQNIEKLRDSSGASITVLAPNQLPLCASAHESDRVVQVMSKIMLINFCNKEFWFSETLFISDSVSPCFHHVYIYILTWIF